MLKLIELDDSMEEEEQSHIGEVISAKTKENNTKEDITPIEINIEEFSDEILDF